MSFSMRNRALSITAIFGVVLALTACSTKSDISGSIATTAGGQKKITLSIPPVGDSLPVYMAMAKGYFTKEGLDINLVPAANGATAINALVSQSTDMALVSYPSLIVAKSSGIPITIAALGVNGTEEYQSGIYVLSGSSVKDPKDLEGKHVAVPSLNSVGDIFLRGLLKDKGYDPTGVSFVEIPQGNMASALKAGDVDAVFMTEPTLSSARSGLDMRAIAYQVGPQGVFLTSDKTFDNNAKAVAGFRAAIAKADADIAADPHGAAAAYMPTQTKMTEAAARKMNLPQYVTTWDADSVQKQIDLMASLKIIKTSFDANELYRQP